MMNLDTTKLAAQMYAKLDNNQVVYDLQNNGLGVYDGQGNLVTLGKAKNGRKVLVSSPLDLSVAVPAIAIRTKVADLKSGDMVYSPNSKDCGFFLKADVAKIIKEGETGNENDLDNDVVNILKADGGKSSVVVATNPMLGPGVLAVRSFVNAGLDSSLPMMLMLSQGSLEKNGDLGKMIALSMMTGNNIFSGLAGEENGMNPMMMMMLLGDGKMDMKQILLMGMMGGQKENAENPMAAMLPLLMMGEGNTGGMDKKMLAMMMMSQGNGGGNANMMQTMLMLELFRGK